MEEGWWTHGRQVAAIIGAIGTVGMLVIGVVGIMLSVSGVRDSDKSAMSNAIAEATRQTDARISAIERRVASHDVAIATTTLREDTQQGLLSEVRAAIAAVDSKVSEVQKELVKRGR